ncbi:hypothetical protein BJ742DRAFT_881297 [Cladochytrium replicatum]|nr:hypothetical protein BJ742DRAFT_881297 [Cladochytrium replicatum]
MLSQNHKDLRASLPQSAHSIHSHSLLSSRSSSSKSSRSQRPSLSDSEIRNLAIRTLAQEFLQCSDLAVESRAYLVESTLPTAILALENLLREVEKRDLVVDETEDEMIVIESGDGTRDGDSDREIGGLLRMTSTSTSQAELDQALNDQSLSGKPDLYGSLGNLDPLRPSQLSFDPINWTAQYLYRHNPRYTTTPTALANASPYAQSLALAASTLKARLLELETNARARKYAEQLEKAREEARLKAIKDAARAEKQKTFGELWATCFTEWTGRLFRTNPGYLTHSEVIEGVKSTLDDTNVLALETLPNKIDELLTRLVGIHAPPTSTGESATAVTSLTTQVTPSQSTNALVRGISSPSLGPDLPNAKYSLKHFVDTLVHLTVPPTTDENTDDEAEQAELATFSVDDINILICAILDRVKVESDAIRGALERAFYYPRESELVELGVGANWREVLGQIFENVTTKAGGDDVEETGAEKGEVSSFLVRSLWDEFVGGVGGSWADAEGQYREWYFGRFVGALGYEGTVGVIGGVRGVIEEGLRTTRTAREAEVDARRGVVLEGLYESITKDEGENGVLVRKLNGGIDLVLGDPEMGVDHGMLDVLARCKFPVMARTLMTKRVGREEFVGHLKGVFAGLQDAEFGAVVEGLRKAFSGVGQQAKDLGEKEERGDGATAEGEEAIAAPHVDPSSEERKKVEAKAREEVEALVGRWDLGVSKVCGEAMDVVVRALKEIHESTVARGRISLEEEDAEEGGAKVLRYVACSEGGEVDIGAKVPVGTMGNSDAETFGGNAGVLAKEVDGVEYVAVPMATVGEFGRTVGVFAVEMVRVEGDGSKPFNQLDVFFLKEMSMVVTRLIELADARAKLVLLAQSVAQFTRESGEVDVDLYIVERSSGQKDIVLLNVAAVARPTTASDQDRSESGSSESAYLMSLDGLVVLKRDENSEYLYQAAIEQQKVTAKSTNAGSADVVAVPIFDNKAVLVGVLKLVAHESSDGSAATTPTTAAAVVENEAKMFEKVVGDAVEMIKGESFGRRGTSKDLDGESIDEVARRTMLFPKLMLLSAREALGSLDSAAISELRSYRKPPLTVHKIIKGVLYVFGKLPKEVKKWSDAVKFVNMDLLKDMIAFDPTAIHKRMRFRRVQKVLKSIPPGDVRKRGSVPAHHMYDWLIVTTDLRKRAVASRKRAKQIAAAAEAEVEEEAEGEDEDEVDDEVSSLGSGVSGFEIVGGRSGNSTAGVAVEGEKAAEGGETGSG